MATSCVYTPSRGNSLFRDLRKQFDYKTARGIFLRAINPKFIETYKDTLTLDSEGIPTLDSLLNNSFMKKFIGSSGIQSALQKKFPHVEDSRDNYNNLLSSAYTFNTTDPQRDDYVAVVSPMEEGKIGIAIKPKSDATIKEFQDQYGIAQLNERIASILSPLGISINDLTQAEVSAGRIGVTDFSNARNLGTSLVNIISVANNHEGERAISEEFSHLVIGAYRGEPLIQRAINTLRDHPEAIQEILGEDFADTEEYFNGNIDMIAEEALGHILQKNLLKSQEEIKTPAPTLFKRLYNWIISKFRGYNENDIKDAIDSVDSAMSTLAQDILKGTRNLTQRDIRNSQRDAQFNALSDRIERNIAILQESAKSEVKKYKISGSKDSSLAESRVNEILRFAEEDADTVEGIFNYAQQALSVLRGLEDQFQMIDTMEPKQKFGFLRNVRMYVQSYGSFLKEMQDALVEEKDEDDNMFLRGFTLEDGTEVSVEDVIKDLNHLSDSLNSRFVKVATPAFIEFLKPFMGEQIVVPFGKNAGKVLTIEELLKEAPSDISFLDRWMQSMADSADVLLQGFDKAVKDANTRTRLETIDFLNRIHTFREKAESMGITDWDWAFEEDDEGNKSGNYISEVNHAQFQKELKEMLEDLDNRYGVNPTGEDARRKIAEKNNWLSTHAITLFGEPMADPTMYRNAAYDALSDTQKSLLNEFLNLKEALDAHLPKQRVNRLKAIQARKSGSERFWESTTSPSTLFDNIKESVAATFLDREDDDQIFGDTSRKGLTDFSGNEFMVLPALYTARLRNPNEISTDAIGTLMAYAWSSIQYKNLDNIVDAMEVGRALVLDNRNTLETRGGKEVKEKFSALNIDVVNKVLTSTPNWESKLNDFFESQLYHRYLKDQGTIGDTNINVNKVTSFILKGSSLAQLGFNWLANLANVATGLGITNIEAAAGQFFSPKELLKADGAYFKEIAHVASEYNKRSKTNKVSLFFDLFNVKQNFEGKTKRLQTRNWLKRLFGENIAFLGQELGDHWLYGRIAIAIAMRKQVKLDGVQMSLWDALQVEDYGESSNIKELNYRKITELDGSALNISGISQEMAHVNQVCFGIYNDEDANAANRVAAGRLLQQYRKWMTIQYSRRFRKGHANLATGTWEEGYYITMGRYLNELRRGGFQFAAQYNNMTEEEQMNIKRAIFELCQFFAIWAIANWVEWPDDKKRPWALKLAEYSSKRLAHELGGLTPSTVMPQELLKTVKSPVPATSVVQNAFNLVNSAIDPSDWTNEISSGPYKGMSNLEKNFIKAPIPGVAQYRQISKFVGDLDNSIQYYVRPAN